MLHVGKQKAILKLRSKIRFSIEEEKTDPKYCPQREAIISYVLNMVNLHFI